MNNRKVHIALGSLMILFLGVSLAFSTLHSHHHIQWHHNGDFADTGNCITADSSICPISGYHLKFTLSTPPSAGGPSSFGNYELPPSRLIIPAAPYRAQKGRSPPTAS